MTRYLTPLESRVNYLISTGFYKSYCGTLLDNQKVHFLVVQSESDNEEDERSPSSPQNQMKWNPHVLSLRTRSRDGAYNSIGTAS